LELDHYIKSGIIESYVLGLASSTEIEELQYMRRLYPSLNAEIVAVERRLERNALEEAVLPPAKLKERIFQRMNWQDETQPSRGRTREEDRSNYTFINIQPNDKQHIMVHWWWKPFFIAVFILSKVCFFFAVFYYLKFRQLQERKLERQIFPTQQVISPK
jgi:hypothetical protein